MTVVDAESRFHVLAVDDSLIDRKLIEMLLKNSSYQGERSPQPRTECEGGNVSVPSSRRLFSSLISFSIASLFSDHRRFREQGLGAAGIEGRGCRVIIAFLLLLP